MASRIGLSGSVLDISQPPSDVARLKSAPSDSPSKLSAHKLTLQVLHVLVDDICGQRLGHEVRNVLLRFHLRAAPGLGARLQVKRVNRSCSWDAGAARELPWHSSRAPLKSSGPRVARDLKRGANDSRTPLHIVETPGWHGQLPKQRPSNTPNELPNGQLPKQRPSNTGSFEAASP